ncbi:pentapeptide repeat-containing protein [Phytohabitans flavus]|nr:pentapeptide repeat-containing protein [Phytohabitans flavus]
MTTARRTGRPVQRTLSARLGRRRRTLQRWPEAGQRPHWSQTATALAGVVSVLLVAAGLYYTNEANRAQQDLNTQGQITDRFGRATDQLGSDQVDVRLGGIYSLGRLIGDSPRDAETIVEVLSAYVREHGSRNLRANANAKVSVDVQAALAVLGRRPATTPRMDFGGANLNSADLSGMDLTSADLTGTSLIDADLSGARLPGTDLTGANLTDIDLTGANLAHANLAVNDFTGADLTSANLTGISLFEANLSFITLDRADLTGSSLEGANLRYSSLTKAHLAETNLTYANLSHADLTDADLRNATLTDADLTDAKVTTAQLATARDSARVKGFTGR